MCTIESIFAKDKSANHFPPVKSLNLFTLCVIDERCIVITASSCNKPQKKQH